VDYSKLRGALREKFGTQQAFSFALGISEASLSAKLNGRTEWRTDEIAKACQLLGIPLEQAHEYFFCPKC
jgi:hypothetical protein